MRGNRRVRAERALSLLCAPLLAAAIDAAASAPYPPSPLITAVSWDFGTIGTLRKAHGSDLWPLAWGVDDNLYGAWGDGGGFDGDANDVGRVSLGFARIEGMPVAGEAASYSGRNVWGAAPLFAQSRASFGGKVDDLISVDGVLYGHGGLWTAANCACSDPTHKSGDNPRQRTLAWSADLGRTWQVAPWVAASDPGSSLQYGRNYQGALDPAHVYYYFQRDIASDASRIYLRRVLTSQLTADPATPGHFEYLTGVDGEGRPYWSTTEASAVAVFYDAGVAPGSYANAAVVYDGALGRYLLATQHGNSAGQIGFFEAAAPWGPWWTVAYYDDWGGLNEAAGEGNGLSFPAKWISTDGRTLWGVFSAVANGFDSFNVIKAVLSIRDGLPRITAPPADTVLSPGERVTVQGVGADLSWTVESIGSGVSPVASGTGSSLTFIVPEDLTGSSRIRITLTGPGSSVYRDYPVATRSERSEVGYWAFDEGAGLVAKDSSGSGNAGALVNGPEWTRGELGDALDFRGSGQAVRVAASASLANLYRQGLTVTVWVKPRSGGYSGRILDKDGNVAGWFLKMSNANVQFVGDQFSRSAVARETARPLVPGTWQHVAATWDGSTSGADVHLYVDGVPSDGSSSDGAGSASDDTVVPLTIGNRLADLARGFDGSIDEVHVYDRVLSGGEIRQQAARVPAVVSSGPRAACEQRSPCASLDAAPGFGRECASCEP